MVMQDLELDVPDAEDLLALFLARVLVDEALPPSALTALASSLPSGCPGLDVVQLTGKLPLSKDLMCGPLVHAAQDT